MQQVLQVKDLFDNFGKKIVEFSHLLFIRITVIEVFILVNILICCVRRNGIIIFSEFWGWSFWDQRIGVYQIGGSCRIRLTTRTEEIFLIWRGWRVRYWFFPSNGNWVFSQRSTSDYRCGWKNKNNSNFWFICIFSSCTEILCLR